MEQQQSVEEVAKSTFPGIKDNRDSTVIKRNERRRGCGGLLERAGSWAGFTNSGLL